MKMALSVFCLEVLARARNISETCFRKCHPLKGLNEFRGSSILGLKTRSQVLIQFPYGMAKACKWGLFLSHPRHESHQEGVLEWQACTVGPKPGGPSVPVLYNARERHVMPWASELHNSMPA